MDELKTESRRIAASILFFAVTTTAAIVLFITAAVSWLADMIGSTAAAAAIMGGFFALVAFIVYAVGVRQAIEYLRRRIETVYEVAETVRKGYRYASNVVNTFLSDLLK